MKLATSTLLLLPLALAACSDDSAGTPTDAGSSVDAPGTDRGTIMLGPGDRPARAFVPSAEGEMPIVVLLHGYSINATLQDAYFRMTQRARERGFVLLLPDGTFDDSGNRFWNALPGFLGRASDVDDVAYLTSLVDEIEARYPIATDRVYLMGHSNGGFMSYRLACDRAERFAGLVSLAGSSYADGASCTPSRPVSVLQIHGDLDDTILYDGIAGGYASAPDIAARWAGYGECDATATPGAPLDYDSAVDGAETETLQYPGCAEGIDVQLWTIAGGGHIPGVTDDGVDAMLDWLLAQ
jgi:polyhydroxybutyrate depolymerase